jgi:DNA-directed RNA polymerase subunit alpha
LLDVSPLRIECTSHTATHGRYEIEPLEEGYGVTLGNALRRILLSSLPGAAITSVKIDAIRHEFMDIPYAREDVTEFLLNLKKVRLKAYGPGPLTLELDVKGSREVTAADITAPSQVEIVNPDQYLLTLDTPEATLHAEFTVEQGKGYASIDGRENPEIGTILVDAVFAPIRRVNYFIERKRVGPLTNFERLVLEIWTDGTVDPSDALSTSAEILTHYFQQVADFSRQIVGADKPAKMGTAGLPPQVLDMPIEQLDLTPRAYNSLKRANITKVGEVMEMSEEELLSIRNFGRKSLDELRDRLALRGFLTPEQEEAFGSKSSYSDYDDYEEEET